jgi:hypothetical protein
VLFFYFVPDTTRDIHTSYIHTLALPLKAQKTDIPLSTTLYQNDLDAEELDGFAVSALRRAIVEVKQRWSVI